MLLLSKAEVARIFRTGSLYEKRSFFVICPKTKSFDESRPVHNFLHEAALIRESFCQGKTIIVKNLEGFNEAIRREAQVLGKEVDVHMYLVPENGRDSFPFHVDDRDVHIRMIYGSKEFTLRDESGDSTILLNSGDQLFIPKGKLHKASPRGASCLLSFGVPQGVEYEIIGGITIEDLVATREDV